MISYNLCSEKWIPCKTLDGEFQEYSLVDVLKNAHQIKEIFYESPVEEISVYRILQAFFIIFTKAVSKISYWEKAYQAGRFDEEKIDDYFAEHSDKFDLFGKDRPFYQHSDTLGMAKSPMILLFQDLSSNNNACLFDHSYNKQEVWMPLKRIAVGIIAQQAFVFGGGISKPTNFRGSAMSGESVFWIKGDNLYESLLLNTPYLAQNDMGYMSMGEPAWEKDLIKSEERVVDEYLDFLTFQSRRLKIELPAFINQSNYNTDSKEILCTLDDKGFSISRCQGDFFKSSVNEPLAAQRIRDKEKTPYPYKMRENRDPWRDSEILYKGYKSEKTGIAPINLLNIKYLQLKGFFKNKSHFKTTIYTVNNASGQPKINMWRKSEMPFYPMLMCIDEGENPRFDFIIAMLEKAEIFSKLLYAAVFNYCKIIKHPSKIVSEINPSGDDLTMIKNMTEKLKPEEDYWASLKTEFYKSLEELAEKTTKDEYAVIVNNFSSFCRNMALSAFDKVLKNTSHAKAFSIARDTFLNKSKDKNNDK